MFLGVDQSLELGSGGVEEVLWGSKPRRVECGDEGEGAEGLGELVGGAAHFGPLPQELEHAVAAGGLQLGYIRVRRLGLGSEYRGRLASGRDTRRGRTCTR